MRAYLIIISIVLLILFGSSCRKNFEYAPSSGNLSFSKDTVYLDTVFTNISSSTHTLKVYNKTRDDVVIPNIKLANGETSGYRLNVDGVAGKSFINIPLFAKDSLYIFIEVTRNIPLTEQNTWLYMDAILFDSGIELQEVPLVTLIKDAHFLFPNTLENGTKEQVFFGLDSKEKEILVDGITLENEQLHFTNKKPYVIYGYASVPEDKELIIDAGARVYFHNNSGIVIQDKASIKINGVLSLNKELQEGEVIFEGDRLESELAKIPGQWGSLRLNKGSINNQINYTTIKNATTGLFIEGIPEYPDNKLLINNSKIYNSSNINLWAKTAKISSNNLVIGGAGNIGLFCNAGGEYSFTHATIANYWTSGFREGYALKIDNEIDLTNSEFNNCIINGNKINEIDFEYNENALFNVFFTTCMINTNTANNENPLLDVLNTQYYSNIYTNEDASFTDANNNIFSIINTSFATDKGNVEKATLAPLDINGVDRLLSPDIGAFELLRN